MEKVEEIAAGIDPATPWAHPNATELDTTTLIQWVLANAKTPFGAYWVAQVRGVGGPADSMHAYAPSCHGRAHGCRRCGSCRDLRNSPSSAAANSAAAHPMPRRTQAARSRVEPNTTSILHYAWHKRISPETENPQVRHTRGLPGLHLAAAAGGGGTDHACDRPAGPCL